MFLLGFCPENWGADGKGSSRRLSVAADSFCGVDQVDRDVVILGEIIHSEASTALRAARPACSGLHMVPKLLTLPLVIEQTMPSASAVRSASPSRTEGGRLQEVLSRQ